MTRILVDADACPVRIRDMIARAAHRRSVPVVFVSHSRVPVLQSTFVSSVEVIAGPDAADAYIAANVQSCDLVVTQDIPLAAQLIPKGAAVITPRGDVFTENNIADVLSRRDLMSELRDAGEVSTRTRPLDEPAIRRFANAFDAALHKLERHQP